MRIVNWKKDEWNATRIIIMAVGTALIFWRTW